MVFKKVPQNDKLGTLVFPVTRPNWMCPSRGVRKIAHRWNPRNVSYPGVPLLHVCDVFLYHLLCLPGTHTWVGLDKKNGGILFSLLYLSSMIGEVISIIYPRVADIQGFPVMYGTWYPGGVNDVILDEK